MKYECPPAKKEKKKETMYASLTVFSEWIRDLNVRPQNSEITRWKHMQTSSRYKHRQGMFAKDSNSTGNYPRTDRLDPMKLEIYCIAKKTVIRVKRQS